MESVPSPDFEAFAASVREAGQRRAAWRADPSLDCYRVFHGYTEGWPGISIDRYGPCAIINKKAALPFPDAAVAQVVRELGDFAAVVLKTHQRIPEAQERRVRYLAGGDFAAPLKVHEDGIFYFADHKSLHTNGFYLDTRKARAWLRQNSQGRRVLNLFAHTGSLGVAARVGGASEVIYIDKQKAMLDKVAISTRFNGLKPDDRGLLAGDLYYHLPRAIKWGQTYAGIVLDPPPLVPPPPRVPKHRPAGQDFATLIETCCQLLVDGAWVLCIYHNFALDHAANDQLIIDAAGGRLQPIWRAAAGDDFPESDVNQRTRMTAFTFDRA